MSRQPTRAEARAAQRNEVYEQRKREARTGRDLLVAAFALLRAELTDLATVNPDAEDQACHNLAQQTEDIAYETRKEADRERKTRLALQAEARRQRR
ncbi:hypothetical protein FAF44_03230 [Nonomuraea sp. MG754425]|uniref:hypothetical protein n=1 Tax=Nonomuraea sp. MG754425 TaxID=2570319 RepID=UPI001F25A8C1|nr:hypothetical protein [Nonomuraea sp. MG754425]MCF6467427.1 hypothetical protein [Nonomuraea sp. MG754425]